MVTIDKKLRWTIIGIIVASIIFIVISQTLRVHPGLVSTQVAVQEQNIELVSGESSIGNSVTPKFYLVNPQNKENLQYDNFRYALEYAKLPYKIIEPNEIQTIEPSPYTVLITAEEKSERLPLNDIKAFVKNGGKLYIGKRFYNREWNDVVGIQEIYQFTDSIYGYQFLNERIQHHFLGHESYENVVNNSLDVDLQDDVDVHIESENIPLYWTHSYSKGQIGYWNGTWLSAKVSRGIFLQTLLELLPQKVHIMAGVKTVFIDDFPAPFPEVWKKEANYYAEQYRMQPPEFFQQVWWEDMKQIAEEHDLLYTNVMIGNYSESLSQTKRDIITRNKKQLLYYARDSILNGYEIGFHGYNHQSLVTKDEEIDSSLGYHPWKNKEEMKRGINILNDLYEEYYPDRSFNSYVPPSNVIGPTGLEAIKEALPNLKVISSLYAGDMLGAFIQEFEQDKGEGDIFHLPRLSSGYSVANSEQNLAFDGLANFGVFTHFVHPDDLIDAERSRNYTFTWEEMKKEFEDFLTEVDEKYPILMPYRATDAGAYMERYLQGNVQISYGKDFIEISGENMPSPINVSVQLEEGQEITSGKSADYQAYHTHETLPIYQIKATNLPIVIPITSKYQGVE